MEEEKMKILLIGMLIIGIIITIFLIISYIILAAVNNSRKKIGDAFPYEAGVSYFVFAVIGSAFFYIFNNRLSPTGEGIAILFLMFFSWILVHILCTKIGKRFPKLGESKFVQFLDQNQIFIRFRYRQQQVRRQFFIFNKTK